jgi:uncharacterized OB-fold protein
MDRPTTKNNDIDDKDFEDDEKMPFENTCAECGGYKNPKRRLCDNCLFANK